MLPSNSASLFQLNNDVAMIEYGIAYFLIALFVLPLFFVVLKTIYLKDRERSNMIYKIMNLVNIFQLGQALSHLVSGPMLVFPNLLIKFDVIIRTGGCIMNGLWMGDFPLMILLVICRILIFSNLIVLKKFPVLIKLILFLILFWTLFLIMVGSVTQNFYLVTPGWDYDYSVSTVRMFKIVELITSFTCLAVSYFAYIFMTYLIYAKKNLISCAQSQKSEIAILLQSTFVTAYITALIIVWHQAIFVNYPIVDMENLRNQAILNGCLIVHCYVNPTLTLICNRSIRENCWKVLGDQKITNKASGITSKRFSMHPTNTI